MIIDGKKISEKILHELREKIERDKLKICLAVVLVGENYASGVYIRKKREACKRIGVVFKLFNFPSDISEPELIEEINKIGKSKEVKGILIQLPLPKNFNAGKVLKAIPENKNAERKSPVVCAVEEILKEYNIDLEGKKIAVIGEGKLVGGPIGNWLKEKNLDYSGMDRIKKADIIISGVGKPKIIKGEMVKEGAIVIDIGFSHDENKKAVGDVDFESVSPKAKLITPVPGGVGPLTVACLLKNLVNG